MKKILIYGAGAVGGYLGGKLAKQGEIVSFVCRPAAAEAISQHGLTLMEGGQASTVRPIVYPSLIAAFMKDQQYDVIFLGMKSYDLNEAIKELRLYSPQPATLITLQNGIGVEDQVKSIFPDTPLVAGSLTTPVRIESPHELVVERTDRGLSLAPTGKEQSIQEWAAVCQQAGVHTTVVANHQSMKWSKALLNMMGNATAAILDMHPSEIYAHPGLFGLEMRMLRETLAVMRELNYPLVNLPGSPARQLGLAVRWLPDWLLQKTLSAKVAAGRGDKMPSFHVDLMNGKEKSEVIFHNGAVATIGRAYQLPTPVNTGLNDILRQLVHHELPLDSYRHQPDKLLAAIPA